MSDDGPPLQGAVPRVEYQHAHRQFLEAVRPPAAMIRLPHVRRALEDGETAATLFPERTTVVTTTTVDDETLAEIHPDEEEALVTAFEPDYHVPTDFPVYGSMQPERRRQNVVRCATGTRQFHDALSGTPTDVLPLLHGTTPEERAVTQQAASEVDAAMGVFYATQHTTAAQQFPALKQDLEVLADEVDRRVLVIGYMNPSDYYEARGHSLASLPDVVQAAAGLNQWLTAVEPRSSSPAEMRESYVELATGVADALGIESPPAPVGDTGMDGASTGR